MTEEIDLTGDLADAGVELGEADLGDLDGADVESAATVADLPGAEAPAEVPQELAAESMTEQDLAAASAASPIPDPFGGQDTPPGEVTFGSASAAGKEVGFEDGTTVQSPKQDALGYVYKNQEDWLKGANKNVLDSAGEATKSS